MVSPKIQQKIVKISALTTRGRNPDNYLYFGRNNDFINSFWNCLTFNADCTVHISVIQLKKKDQGPNF